jgi:hypothetical protein
VFGLFVASWTLLGAGLGVALFPRSGTGALRRVAWAIVGVAGLALIGYQVAWMADERQGDGLGAELSSRLASEVSPSTLAGPGVRGPYEVRRFTYGSGDDRLRPEFGAEAGLRTQPVDGSRLVWGWRGDAEGFRDWPARARTAYFGFDATAMPLQGQVWYPVREEPSPLVVMVHGRHRMNDSSDGGHGHLGELLASRGFIFASIDQNFLGWNPVTSFTRMLGLFGLGMRAFGGETDARAWLALEHVRLWHRWNAAPGGPLEGRVDTENIALVGHSFGGEAVGVAAVFNRLSAYPDDARIPFDFGFGIRSVVAIAPVDGRYQPGGAPASPRGVNYLVIQGSHDADVQSFEGVKAYERVDLAGAESASGTAFKSAVYVHRANHGMFNSGWGRRDIGSLSGRALDVSQLLEPAEQRQVAEVFVSAFLEATLAGRGEHRSLFQDWRWGASWLPRTLFLQRYSALGDEVLASFEEDADPRTGTFPGTWIEGRGLAAWREGPVPMIRGELGVRAVRLAWWTPGRVEPAGAPMFGLRFAGEGLDASGDASLLLTLADDRRPGSPGLMDLSVVLEDAEGRTAAAPLARFSRLLPRFEARLGRDGMLRTEGTSETVLQDIEVPLAELAGGAGEGLDLARLRRVALRFDRSTEGALVLASVGLRR